MGDHRATIIIDFEMHGVKTRQEMWINWWRGAAYDLPTSVTDFFAEAEEASMSALDEAEVKESERRRKAKEKLRQSAKSKLTEAEWDALKD